MAKAKKTRKPLSASEKKKAYVSVNRRDHRNFLNARAEGLSPNFEYTFTINGVEVSLLDINSTLVDDIELSGEVYANKSKPFYIEIRARLNSPAGNGTFQLKDLRKNKNVFTEAKELTFSSTGNGGLFLEDVELP